MAVAIHVYIRDKGAAETDPISVEHVFYGATEEEADKKRLAHLAGCENFALAEAENRIEETVEEIDDDEAPTWETVSADETIDVEGAEVEPEDSEG